MVAARNLISAREPNLAAPGGEVAAASGPDPAWLAQAIKVRKLAFRLHRNHMLNDLPTAQQGDAVGSDAFEDSSKLLEDYLTESEKLFELTGSSCKK